MLKAPFSPLIAQLADRAGMIVSPKAAQGSRRQVRPQARLRRTLQVRRARAAGPHRGREVPALLERGQRPHRPRRLPADRGVDRAARQPQVGQPRPDRARARHRPQGDQGRSQAEARHPDRDRLPGPDAQPGERRGRQERPVRQGPARAPGAGGGDRPQGALRRRLQRRGAARQPVGQPQEPLLPAEVPGARARRGQGQEAAGGCRRDDAGRASTSWCRTIPKAGRSPR